MSAQEFGEWHTFFQKEGFMPSAQRQRHAHLLAATANGPIVRHDRRMWSAADFLPADPWTTPEPQEVQAPTAQELAQQVDHINRLME